MDKPRRFKKPATIGSPPASRVSSCLSAPYYLPIHVILLTLLTRVLDAIKEGSAWDSAVFKPVKRQFDMLEKS